MKSKILEVKVLCKIKLKNSLNDHLINESIYSSIHSNIKRSVTLDWILNPHDKKQIVTKHHLYNIVINKSYSRSKIKALKLEMSAIK